MKVISIVLSVNVRSTQLQTDFKWLFAAYCLSFIIVSLSDLNTLNFPAKLREPEIGQKLKGCVQGLEASMGIFKKYEAKTVWNFIQDK